MNSEFFKKSFFRENKLFFLLMLLCFFQGTFFIFYIPPWQSADETTYFEAFIVYGKHFFQNTPIQSDPKLEQSILISMKKYDFWKRIGIPEPIDIPVRFSDCFFLKSAPSKIGRSHFLFYLFGIPTYYFFPTDLLFQLFFLRFINLIVLLLAIYIILLAVKILFPNDNITLIGATLFLLSCQTLWQMGATVNLEPALLFVNSFGFFILTRINNNKFKAMYQSLIIYLLLGILIKWTQFFIGISFIFLLHVIFRTRLKNIYKNKNIMNLFIWLILIVLSSSATLFLGTSHTLLHHEFKQVIQSLKSFDLNHNPIIQASFTRLFLTFWWGIGWLTIKPPTTLISMFIFLSCWLFLTAVIEIIFNPNKNIRRILLFCFFYFFILITIIIFRSTFYDKSIQGRYFFPFIPFLAFMGSLSFKRLFMDIRIYNRLFRTVLFSFFLFYITINFEVIYSYYVKPYLPSTFAFHLSRFEWISNERVAAHLNLSSRYAKLLLRNGWYATEVGQLIWMRNKSNIDLPWLPQNNLIISIKLKAFIPREDIKRKIQILFNQLKVYENTFKNDDIEIVNFIIPKAYIKRSLNTLEFYCDSTDSPAVFGINDDMRPLSFGVFDIFIRDLQSKSFSNTELSYWALLPGQKILTVKHNNGLRLREDEPSSILIGFQDKQKKRFVFKPEDRVKTFKKDITFENFKISDSISIKSFFSPLFRMKKHLPQLFFLNSWSFGICIFFVLFSTLYMFFILQETKKFSSH